MMWQELDQAECLPYYLVELRRLDDLMLPRTVYQELGLK